MTYDQVWRVIDLVHDFAELIVQKIPQNVFSFWRIKGGFNSILCRVRRWNPLLEKPLPHRCDRYPSQNTLLFLWDPLLFLCG